MENIQTQIVGFESVPRPRFKYSWDFLASYAQKLQAGQALRIVIPKGNPTSGATNRWRRLFGRKAKSCQRVQPDKSTVIWLWLDGPQ